MLYNINRNFAGVVELADAPDSKSGGSDTMRVRPPPPAPKKPSHMTWLFSIISNYSGKIFALKFTVQKEHTMQIRKATLCDIDEIQRVYAYAREYMRTHGNPTQWGNTYPTENIILSDIEKGDLYVCTENEKIHGVFAFIEGDDPTYAVIEGKWTTDEPYNVMHRMASDGEIRGIGKAALDFCKSHGKNVRADTHKDNITMQNMLSKNGFVPCGIIHVENGSERIAYQYTM